MNLPSMQPATLPIKDHCDAIPDHEPLVEMLELSLPHADLDHHLQEGSDVIAVLVDSGTGAGPALSLIWYAELRQKLFPFT